MSLSTLLIWMLSDSRFFLENSKRSPPQHSQPMNFFFFLKGKHRAASGSWCASEPPNPTHSSDFKPRCLRAKPQPAPVQKPTRQSWEEHGQIPFLPVISSTALFVSIGHVQSPHGQPTTGSPGELSEITQKATRPLCPSRSRYSEHIC